MKNFLIIMSVLIVVILVMIDVKDYILRLENNEPFRHAKIENSSWNFNLK